MDPLAFWWTTEVTVERRTGEGAYGPVYAPSTTEPAWVEEGHRLIRGIDGREIVSTARVFLPIETDRVPAGSRVTLSAEHGGGIFDVLACSRHHHPAPGMPSHWEVAL